ncbi:hypothetical protein V1520DRAFT_343099 [Lipomyces starkeyi]|uniref:Uncharacterized protein n=1 Tax=Lipomyces starkeyi NRRL Y-11557 TaxID=675824 RepID=A0A1E3PVP1_LIPST|nr:hypothetical protein LIPSTDRAFT_75728 [Lipomyces starkeyi NRRL Y-11557]
MGLGKLVECGLQVTPEEYLALMDRFKVEETPLSVAMLDMDRHWIDNEMVRTADSVDEQVAPGMRCLSRSRAFLVEIRRLESYIKWSPKRMVSRVPRIV